MHSKTFNTFKIKKNVISGVVCGQHTGLCVCQAVWEGQRAEGSEGCTAGTRGKESISDREKSQREGPEGDAWDLERQKGGQCVWNKVGGGECLETCSTREQTPGHVGLVRQGKTQV